MSRQDWDNLSHVEQCFLINAMEMDILPGVRGDLDEAERRLPFDELADILLSLVDRGWIEVRRYERWISEEGLEGLAPGEVVPRPELSQVLADPANWEYPDDVSWIGALTLVCTEVGLAVSRLSLDEVAERDQACSAFTPPADSVGPVR
ncbi:hypothetical protein NCC78_28245 [Micromonospora phytophila]|uniref:hypothetical protein n=1 Tax=Micromonospora phytophila TaxID=709888 RepID=UPI00202F1104|nr:hypothetical protein [Micromonospora phytophila]MCM0678534.1 hypothetical protein [Micromonospora phytophila]